MRQLDKIGQLLQDRNWFILVPNDMRNAPIVLPKTQKDDVDGVLILGEYYTVADFEAYFGKQYQVENYIDDAHILVSWVSTNLDEIPALEAMLNSNGLVNVLRDIDGKALESEDIDWATIPVNGYAILTKANMRVLPKMAPQIIEEVV